MKRILLLAAILTCAAAFMTGCDDDRHRYGGPGPEYSEHHGHHDGHGHHGHY